MDKNSDNLDHLLSQFFSSNDCETFKDNLRFADEQFRLHQPKSSVSIEQIKANLAGTISARSFFSLRYQIPAAAAAVIVTAASVFFIFHNDQYRSRITAHQWQSSNLAVDDIDLLQIRNDIESISSELSNCQQNDNSELANSLTELENDFIDLDKNFWKG